MTGYREERPVVLALPRGGVPVGYEVAGALGAPLDVFIARKLGAPNRPELGIGAVAQDGLRVLNEWIIREIGISEEYIERIAAEVTKEAERRLKLFRGERPEPEVCERTAIFGRRHRHRCDDPGGDRCSSPTGSSAPRPRRARVRHACGRVAPP